MPYGHLRQLLINLLRARVTPAGWSWFEKALQATRAPLEKERLLGFYAAASRNLGKQALHLDEREKTGLKAMDPMLSLDQWGADELGRAILLMSVVITAPGEDDSFVLECYLQADSREQQGWLRALSLMSGCERFVETAVDACRTNILPLFEAIACENPYPCRYFPELNFNQMVLKCLFNDIAISRIVGLDSRFNEELSRMADDYVSEREAAGREVPVDIWLVLAPRIHRERLARVHQYLHHENPAHRYWAALALGYTHDAASRSELERQRKLENEAKILGILDQSLARMDR